MPRTFRLKTNHSIFHIICRSISEVNLFIDKIDKDRYLSLLKKYQQLYKFKVYGYCLMDNHAHFMIDVNGADISKIMHSINLSYAMYFNNRHNRHGHLFQDRFISKIVKNMNFLYNLSAYIHNNPVDIEGYSTCPENYEFSSLSVYLGIISDRYEIIDGDFILSLFGADLKESRANYAKYIFKCDDKEFKSKEIELENQKTQYRSERKILVRECKEEDVVNFVCEKMNVKKVMLYSKSRREVVKAKALLVFLMRSLCNFKCNDICKILGNITQGRVSTLSSLSIKLINEDKDFREAVEEFIAKYAA